MEFILWIVISGWNGNSQQAALFPTEQSCAAARDTMGKSIKGHVTLKTYTAVCLPRGDVSPRSGSAPTPGAASGSQSNPR